MCPVLDRRAFLASSLGGLAALARPGAAQAASGPARTLVLIQLSGGVDGLSLLVPHADDAYGRARRATRLAAEDVLRLDVRVGLHPELTGLGELFTRGELALIEGIGYPEPNRSHFRSLDVWHAADARGRGLGSGWIGRCAERLPDAAPHTVVHLGARPPFSLHSARRAPLCLTPALLRAGSGVDASGERLASPGPEGASSGTTLTLVSRLLEETRRSSARLEAALARPSDAVKYPRSAFAQDLRSAAGLIHAGLGVRVCALELDGFDTHRDQTNRLARLLADLDRAIAAFARDLATSAAGRETLVVLFSEFGRRVEENASGGTDHGAAGLALALGARVRGGLYGQAPPLDSLADGDLAFTTDFRRLYATCIEHTLGLDPSAILGSGFEALAIV